MKCIEKESLRRMRFPSHGSGGLVGIVDSERRMGVTALAEFRKKGPPVGRRRFLLLVGRRLC